MAKRKKRMTQMQFSKFCKKLSAIAKTAKAKTSKPLAAKVHQVVKTKIHKSQPTKCANSIKKENAGKGKSAEMNIPNSAKKIIKHGSLKFSSQVCGGKCEKPHPDAC
jgi:hypothetical protein